MGSIDIISRKAGYGEVAEGTPPPRATARLALAQERAEARVGPRRTLAGLGLAGTLELPP
eukprot:5748464-Alexandrium_andersonii.AAC.1